MIDTELTTERATRELEINLFDLKRGEKSLGIILQMFDSSEARSERSELVANARDIHAIAEQLIEAAGGDAVVTVRFSP